MNFHNEVSKHVSLMDQGVAELLANLGDGSDQEVTLRLACIWREVENLSTVYPVCGCLARIGFARILDSLKDRLVENK